MVVVLRCRLSVLDQWPIGYANLCLLYLNHSSLERGLLISAPEVEPLASRRSAAARTMRTSSNVRAMRSLSSRKTWRCFISAIERPFWELTH